ncbi:MAG: site-specific integrase [Paracoccaceae bacterium]
MSLGSPDARIANERAPEVAAQILKKVKAAQLRVPAIAEVGVFEPSHEAMEEAARQYYEMEVEADLDELADAENAAVNGRNTKSSAKSFKVHAKEWRKAMASGDNQYVDIEFMADEFGFEFIRGSHKENKFRQLLMRAYIEACERWAEHDKQKFGGEPSDPMFRRSNGVVSASPMASTISSGTTLPKSTLLELWPDHEKQVGDGCKRDTMNDRRLALESFANFVGRSTPLCKISKEHARTWFGLLFDLPIKSGEVSEFRGMNLTEIVELNKALQRPVLRKPTINKYVSGVRTFYKWLVEQGRTPENIFDGLSAAVSRGRSERQPFSVSQLQILFNSPLFIGCAGPSNITTLTATGDYKVRDWRFWLPLLAAYTGARLGELAQLETSDIKVGDRINYIFITDQGVDPAKSIKSDQAQRRVPIHSMLIRLGFLDFVGDIHSKGITRVFPDAGRDNKEQFGPVSKFFQRYFSRMNFGMATGQPDPVFHSFRHSVVDELRRKHNEHEFQPLIGHAYASTTRSYGKAETLDLQSRKALIEDIEYPGLDLSKISAFENRDS